jgi:protein-tyrosine-phosphatase
VLLGGMRRLRVLVLCTGNSARSQIAEAIIQREGEGYIEVASAGSRPATRVHPLAVEVLADAGIDWLGREPKGLDAVIGQPWDVVITVCDRARDACPLFPGGPVTAHWGLPDPAERDGSPAERRQAFEETYRALTWRIERLLEPPLAGLDREDIENRLAAISSRGASR